MSLLQKVLRLKVFDLKFQELYSNPNSNCNHIPIPKTNLTAILT